MTKDDEQFLKLGRMVGRMIHDLGVIPADEVGYGRRSVTFPGGEVELFVVRGEALADQFETDARRLYKVESVTPNSQKN